jgi:hypothetical protein
MVARVYMLADPKQPAWTDKSMKKEKLPTKQKDMGELTKIPIHAWSRVHPST